MTFMARARVTKVETFTNNDEVLVYASCRSDERDDNPDGMSMSRISSNTEGEITRVEVRLSLAKDPGLKSGDLLQISGSFNAVVADPSPVAPPPAFPADPTPVEVPPTPTQPDVPVTPAPAESASDDASSAGTPVVDDSSTPVAADPTEFSGDVAAPAADGLPGDDGAGVSPSQ